MIRKTSEMPSLLLRIIADVETKVVEYKAAKQNYDFEDIGKYFSALSNEANLRKAECGWLFFGISNDRQIKGTAYRKDSQTPSVGLRRLKHEIAQYTNNDMLPKRFTSSRLMARESLLSRYRLAASQRQRLGTESPGHVRMNPS